MVRTVISWEVQFDFLNPNVQYPLQHNNYNLFFPHIPSPVNKYQVCVYTEVEEYAGLEGHVYITVYGDRGDTGKRWLLKSATEPPEEKFQKGRVSVS